ncbi:hypothetical protein LSH36_150g01000 [Paralvinella palmiformis]|uniref:Uncharacterized protein n=1 Tax=Paralvinella palmiformis TaxID=53620 RepID=A0AAD9NA08_9ANNE|nr:hypothetical protein LSH36_150g01000 [Paralvinella palmiformis]
MNDTFIGLGVNGDCIQKQHGSISRDKFIEHNTFMIEQNQYDNLWTINTGYIYHGFGIFCYLKPMIETRILENEVVPSGAVNYFNDEDSSHLCDSRRKVICRSAVKLSDRQKCVLHYIETKKPYNHILHYLSIFRLPKAAILLAKDQAIIAKLTEDPNLLQKDEEDMNILQPYLCAIRKLTADDKSFDDQLVVITRDLFIEHNKSISENEVDDHIWTHNGKQVFDGVKLHSMLLPYMKHPKEPYYTKNRNYCCDNFIPECTTKMCIFHSSYNPHYLKERSFSQSSYKRHCKFYSTSFQFLCTLKIRPNVAEKIKRETAIGRLREDPDLITKDREQILELIEIFKTSKDKTEVIDDMVKCAERHYNSSTPVYNKSKIDDLSDGNKHIFVIPNDVDVESFRSWPDYMWYDRETDRKWTDDWTSTNLITNSQFLETSRVESLETNDVIVCWHTPWREDWQTFDLAIDGEAAWDVVPADIVKTDQATETQLITLEKRCQRLDKRNPECMAKIRQKLSKYFIIKYGYSKEKMSLYDAWSDSMVCGWETFTNLCTIWHSEYVQSREVPQELFTPSMPRQVFSNQDQIARHRDSIRDHFLRHHFLKHYDPDWNGKWIIAMKEGWSEFQDLCQTWTSSDISPKHNVNTGINALS